MVIWGATIGFSQQPGLGAGSEGHSRIEGTAQSCQGLHTEGASPSSHPGPVALKHDPTSSQQACWIWRGWRCWCQRVWGKCHGVRAWPCFVAASTAPCVCSDLHPAHALPRSCQPASKNGLSAGLCRHGAASPLRIWRSWSLITYFHTINFIEHKWESLAEALN